MRYMNMNKSWEVLDSLRYLLKEEWRETLMTLSNLLKLLCIEIHLLTFWWQLRLSGPSLLRSVWKFPSFFYRHSLSWCVLFFCPIYMFCIKLQIVVYRWSWNGNRCYSFYLWDLFYFRHSLMMLLYALWERSYVKG